MIKQEQNETGKKDFPVWLGCLMFGGLAVFACYAGFVLDRDNKVTSELLQLQKEVSSASVEWATRSDNGDVVIKYNDCVGAYERGLVPTRANCLDLTNNKELTDVVLKAIKNSPVSESVKNSYMTRVE